MSSKNKSLLQLRSILPQSQFFPVSNKKIKTQNFVFNENLKMTACVN